MRYQRSTLTNRLRYGIIRIAKVMRMWCVLTNRCKDNTYPKCGEVGWGKDENAVGHMYKGYRPYLIISNDQFNQSSGCSWCIPFTTKRKSNSSPVHVNFSKGTIAGLYQDSTLMIENLTQIANQNFGNAVHLMSIKHMSEVARALEIQMPFLNAVQTFYNHKKQRSII